LLDLQAYRYSGSPTATADLDLTAYGNCDPPRRKTLADGTVLQLYPVQGSQQYLRIYTSGGSVLMVSSMLKERWPVDEAGLAAIGDELAKVG
jgi:hypothetical protein